MVGIFKIHTMLLYIYIFYAFSNTAGGRIKVERLHIARVVFWLAAPTVPEAGTFWRFIFSMFFLVDF